MSNLVCAMASVHFSAIHNTLPKTLTCPTTEVATCLIHKPYQFPPVCEEKLGVDLQAADLYSCFLSYVHDGQMTGTIRNNGRNYNVV